MGGSDGVLRIYDSKRLDLLAALSLEALASIPNGSVASIVSVTFCLSGAFVAFGTSSGVVDFYEFGSNSPIVGHSITHSVVADIHVCASPDGTQVVSCSPSQICVHRIARNGLSVVVEGTVSISPFSDLNGRTLMTIPAQGDQAFDVILGTFRGDFYSLNGYDGKRELLSDWGAGTGTGARLVSITPDGQILFCLFDEKLVIEYLYDDTDATFDDMGGDRSSVISLPGTVALAACPNPHLPGGFAYAHHDGSVFFRRATRRKREVGAPNTRWIGKVEGTPTDLAWSPDGSVLVVGCASGSFEALTVSIKDWTAFNSPPPKYRPTLS